MPGNLSLSLGTLCAFLLVLARVSGAFVFVPLPGATAAPGVARAVLAVGLTLALNSRWPAVDAASMLGFAVVAHGDVMLTEAGKQFATAGVHRSHRIFKNQLLQNIPFASTVVEAIRHKNDGRIGKDFLVDILDEHFSESEAERQFQTLVDWGRYAQLFEYDADDQRLYIAEQAPEEM